MKTLALFLFAVLVVSIVAAGVFISRVDYDNLIAPLETPPGVNKIRLPNLIATENLNGSFSIYTAFPCPEYLSGAGFRSVDLIESDLVYLDSINPADKMLNRETVAVCLTESLQERLAPRFKEFNADSLIRLLQQAERFNNYSKLAGGNDMVYRTIYDHWMNFIVNRANEAYDHNYSVKYDYKFRYLINRLEEQRYMSRIGNNNYEKALFYLIDGRYAYLWNRFWIGTTLLFKFIFFGLGLVVLYGFYAIFRLHFNTKSL